MGIVPIFAGRVTPSGKLLLANTEARLRTDHLRSLVGQEVEVIIRKKRVKRSLDINAYWHAVPFRLLADHWGEDIETTKLLILGECFGWRELGEGRRIPIKPALLIKNFAP